MSTIAPGNTKAGAIQGRNFIMTINEKTIPETQKIINYLEGLKGFVYILVCEHIGQKNKHYHLYVQFETVKRLSFKKLLGAHIDKCFGSAQQNISYVKAEDEKHTKLGITSKLIYENGEPKTKGGIPTIKEVKMMSEEEVNDLPVNLINCARKAREVNPDIKIEDWHKDVQVLYIQGPSGCGKSLKAKKIIAKNSELLGGTFNEVSYHNGFWTGIGNSICALYDDFRDTNMPASEFIKFIDYNIHTLNVKGSFKQNKYELIIITSVQRLSQIYRNVSGEPREQWVRRIHLIDMYKDKSEEELMDDLAKEL